MIRTDPSRALRLGDLATGERARVLSVQAEPVIRRRLQEMGITRGETIHVEKVAPLGDPMELVVRGYHLTLRREESSCILVEREV